MEPGDSDKLRELRDKYGVGLNHVSKIYAALDHDISRVEEFIAYDPLAVVVKLLQERVDTLERRIECLENPAHGIIDFSQEPDIITDDGDWR